jgi:hypothetical protein
VFVKKHLVFSAAGVGPVGPSFASEASARLLEPLSTENAPPVAMHATGH